MAHKIFDKKGFSKMIEEYAINHDCSYMDAIIDYCLKSEMELEVAAKLLNSKIRKTIELEAMGSNMLKYKHSKLDF